MVRLVFLPHTLIWLVQWCLSSAPTLRRSLTFTELCVPALHLASTHTASLRIQLRARHRTSRVSFASTYSRKSNPRIPNPLLFLCSRGALRPLDEG